MLRLLLLFTTVPLVELALLLWIGARLGVLPTIALILVTGAAGAGLARHQGLVTWRRFHAALGAGRLPAREVMEGLLILLAGAVLLTPGVLTDAAGFVLLIPPVRRSILRRAEAHLRARAVSAQPGGARAPSRPESAEVIDAEFEVVDRGGDRSRAGPED